MSKDDKLPFFTDGAINAFAAIAIAWAEREEPKRRPHCRDGRAVSRNRSGQRRGGPAK
jgi:hypothetical protein